MQKNTLTYVFLGIGGIGMSALARFVNHLGYKAIGYDAQKTDLTEQLEKEGISVFYRDSLDILPENLTPGNTLVVRTPAIKKSVLLDYFVTKGFNVIKRAEFLAQIAGNFSQFAVSGTHGKTTTTAILTHILKISGALKAGFVGGITKNYNSNLVLGNGKYVAIEADEYDRAFLLFQPEFLTVTSLEADHLDIYKNFENLRQAFEQFVRGAKPNAKILLNSKVKLNIERKFYTYSAQEMADFYATNITHKGGKQFFTLHLIDSQLNTYINFPGIAYLENAISAAGLAFLAGIDLKHIQQGLETYNGTHRRFDLKFSDGKHFIYDDYAHHPTEITALYEATRLFYPEKELTIVFQPHLYSRTRDFAGEFGQALSKFDRIIVTDIYPAREKPIKGVNPQLVLDKVRNTNKGYVAFDELANYIIKNDFEVLLITGAGNINTIIPQLIQKLKRN